MGYSEASSELAALKTIWGNSEGETRRDARTVDAEETAAKELLHGIRNRTPIRSPQAVQTERFHVWSPGGRRWGVLFAAGPVVGVWMDGLTGCESAGVAVMT